MTSVVDTPVIDTDDFERKYTQHCVKNWNESLGFDAFEVADDKQKFSLNCDTSSTLIKQASCLEYFGLNPKCFISFHYGKIYAEWENSYYMLNDSIYLRDIFISNRSFELSIKRKLSAKERQILFLWANDYVQSNEESSQLITANEVELLELLEKIEKDPTPFKQMSNADYILYREGVEKKEKEKIQADKENQQNDDVSPVERDFPVLNPQIKFLALVRKNGFHLNSAPERMRTAKACLVAVSTDGLALTFVPKNQRSLDVYLAAVSQNGLALQHIPMEQRSLIISNVAVKQNGMALQFVPVEHRNNLKTCMVAVKQCGLALKYVPVEYLNNHELCLRAVSQDGFAIQYLSSANRTYELCLEAVKHSGRVLGYVPDWYRTSEMNMTAVSSHGGALKYVVPSDRNNELCLAAVTRTVSALEDVPKEQINDDIIIAALKHNDENCFKFIPDLEGFKKRYNEKNK